MLYNVVSFCVQLSDPAVCTHVPSFSSLPPKPAPSPAPRSSQSTQLSSPSGASSFPLDTCFTQGSVYVPVILSPFVPSSPFPLCVYKSILFVWVSIPALQTGSSVPFSCIPCVCVNIQYLLRLTRSFPGRRVCPTALHQVFLLPWGYDPSQGQRLQSIPGSEAGNH